MDGKQTISNIRKSGYIKENLVDLAISLLVYFIFGFDVAVIVILALIMADVATIMKRMYK